MATLGISLPGAAIWAIRLLIVNLLLTARAFSFRRRAFGSVFAGLEIAGSLHSRNLQALV